MQSWTSTVAWIANFAIENAFDTLTIVYGIDLLQRSWWFVYAFVHSIDAPKQNQASI